MKGQYRGALRQVDRSLAAIESYEYSFMMAKAGLLGCLERWVELVALLKLLLKRYPRDADLLHEVARLFMAHGDWRTSLHVAGKARRFVRLPEDRRLLESLNDTRLTCLYALGGTERAAREARRLLRTHPNLTLVRIRLRHIESGGIRIEPWAPRSAAYLKAVRRLVT